MYMRMPVETTAIRVDGAEDTGFSAEREGGALTEVACWAHARRKIHDVYISSISAAAEEGLKRISELYAIENEIRGLPESERLAVRQRRSKSLLASLHEWMEEKNATLSKNPDWAKRSAMSRISGTPSVITVMMVWQRRIITQRKERFVPSVSGKRIRCSSATITVESVVRYCTD